MTLRLDGPTGPHDALQAPAKNSNLIEEKPIPDPLDDENSDDEAGAELTKPVWIN